MKHTHIVYMNAFPNLGKTFADSLEFERFQKEGYELVYIDMSNIFFPETREVVLNEFSHYCVQKDFFIRAETKSEVKELIKKYARKAWFFPLHIAGFAQPVGWMWLMRAFKKYKCEWIMQEWFPMP